MPKEFAAQRLSAIGLSLVVLTGMTGCQKAAAKKAEPKVPEVMISTPISRQITDFEEYTGRLAPVKMVDIRARVSGYLDSVNFEDGADLAENAPLFQIDARPFTAAMAQAEANVKQIESRLDRLRRQEERLARLANQKVTTAEDVDLVTSQRKEADAELQSARAAVDLAKLNLEFTEIRSPIAGRISRRLVDPGNLVTADMTHLATIVALDPIYAYFDIDERTVLQIRRQEAEGTAADSVGRLHVQLALADEEDFTIDGVIDFEDNQISATTGTLRLRAEISNPEKLLAPGMFVRVRLPIGQPHDAVMVREEALGSDQGQRFVYVLNERDEVEYRRIQTGRVDDGYRVVSNGLELEDRVIVKGLQRVRPGLKVAPKIMESTVAHGTAAPEVRINPLTSPASDKPATVNASR